MRFNCGTIYISSEVKVKGQISRSQEEMPFKMFGATSSEGSSSSVDKTVNDNGNYNLTHCT